MPLKLYERPNGIYHIRGTVQGRRVDESARTRSKAEAEAIRAKLEADIFTRSVYGDKAVATFAEAAEAYLLAGNAPDHLTPLLGRIGFTPLKDIDQAFVDKLADEMKPNAKPSTRVRQIYTPISAVMNHVAPKLCDPVRFRKPSQGAGRIEYLTPAEVDALLDILPPYLQRLVTFYVATGCRATEALNLEWRDVSPAAERIIFWETKAGYSRGVDLQHRARKALPQRPEEPGFVFLNSRGEPWHGYDAVNLMLRRICERHGFKRHVHCHMLRHTWATWAYAVTRDLNFLMAQGGWKSASMVLRYAHAGSADLATEVKAHGWEIRGKPVRAKPKNLASPAA